MQNPLTIIFQDPIILAVSMIFIGTVFVLVWALKTYKALGDERTNEDDLVYDEPSAEQGSEKDRQGLDEARIQEFAHQLEAIGRRLDSIERMLLDKKSFDETLQQTVSSKTHSPELEKFMQRIDSRLELISADKPAASAAGPELERIESKLDSVRKLLVLLSDGGGSDQNA